MRNLADRHGSGIGVCLVNRQGLKRWHAKYVANTYVKGETSCIRVASFCAYCLLNRMLVSVICVLDAPTLLNIFPSV